MDKSNIQKITKLTYVFILGCLSYYLLIGKYYDNHSIADSIRSATLKNMTSHWYLQCPNDKNRYGYKSCDTRRFTKIQLDDEVVDVNDKWSSSRISSWNNKRKADEFVYVYNSDRTRISQSKKLRETTKNIVWGLFFFSLFLIWISRGLSIPILNKVRSIINSGWDKI
jgi:Ca2+/Na+ antiporter